MLRRFQLVTTTPALEARSLCLQRNWETSVTAMLAERMEVDPAKDLRPGVVAATTMAAMRVATANWLARGGKGDLPAIVAASLDLLDGGLQAAAAAPARRRGGSSRPGAPGRAALALASYHLRILVSARLGRGTRCGRTTVGAFTRRVSRPLAVALILAGAFPLVAPGRGQADEALTRPSGSRRPVRNSSVPPPLGSPPPAHRRRPQSRGGIRQVHRRCRRRRDPGRVGHDLCRSGQPLPQPGRRAAPRFPSRPGPTPTAPPTPSGRSPRPPATSYASVTRRPTPKPGAPRR